MKGSMMVLYAVKRSFLYFPDTSVGEVVDVYLSKKHLFSKRPRLQFRQDDHGLKLIIDTTTWPEDLVKFMSQAVKFHNKMHEIRERTSLASDPNSLAAQRGEAIGHITSFEDITVYLQCDSADGRRLEYRSPIDCWASTSENTALTYAALRYISKANVIDVAIR